MDWTTKLQLDSPLLYQQATQTILKPFWNHKAFIVYLNLLVT